MNIEKEKEAFEAWLKSLNENGRTTYFLGQESTVAWEAWQAKAQAVPEGFVLVSKNELKMELCSIRDLNNGEHSNSIIEDCVCNIEAMIEAQEQNQ